MQGLAKRHLSLIVFTKLHREQRRNCDFEDPSWRRCPCGMGLRRKATHLETHTTGSGKPWLRRKAAHLETHTTDSGKSLSGEVRDRSCISGSLSEEQETGPVNAARRPCG